MPSVVDPDRSTTATPRVVVTSWDETATPSSSAVSVQRMWSIVPEADARSRPTVVTSSAVTAWREVGQRSEPISSRLHRALPEPGMTESSVLAVKLPSATVPVVETRVASSWLVEAVVPTGP